MIAGEAAALIITAALLHLAAPHGGGGVAFGERGGGGGKGGGEGGGSAGGFGSVGERREASIGSVGGLGTRRGGSERRADVRPARESPAAFGRDDEGRARSGGAGLLEELEGRLLGVFGLQRRPRPGTGVAVPAYLMQLYRAQQPTEPGSSPRRRWARADEEPAGEKDVDEDAKEEAAFPREAQGRANTVRGFHHDEFTEKLSPGYSTEDGTTWRFLFNLSSIPQSEEVTAAELRVHRERAHSPCPPSPSSPSSAWPLCEPAPRTERINVYEILATLSSPSGVASRLLDTRVARTDESRWETFDVSPAVWRWTRGSAPNRGFAVEVLPVRRPRDGPGDGVPPREWPGRSHSPGDESRRPELRPLLVTFGSDGDGRAPFVPRSRARRASRPAANKARRKPRYGCRRHALYVDFREVGWNDWIVAPPGYHAYFCHGECPFPLADHLNSTNHAIVQTLVNSVNASIPRACCVPTELSPISMLYLDEYGKVVLKNYQDMVVEGCGCR